MRLLLDIYTCPLKAIKTLPTEYDINDERMRKLASAASPERNSHIMHQNYHLQDDFLVRTHLGLLAFRTRLREGTYSANRR